MAWAEEDVRLYHFRDKQKNEVDLVLEKSDSKVIGIEVKASATIRANDFEGLIKLADFAGQHFDQGIMFYTGNEVLPFNLQGRQFHALPLSMLAVGDRKG